MPALARFTRVCPAKHALSGSYMEARMLRPLNSRTLRVTAVEDSMTPEEERYLEQHMQEQKQKRVQQLTAYKRRMKFNPLDGSSAVSSQASPAATAPASTPKSSPKGKPSSTPAAATASTVRTPRSITAADIAALSDSDDMQTFLRELDLDDVPEVQLVDDDDDDAPAMTRPLSISERAAQKRKLAQQRRSTAAKQQAQQVQQSEAQLRQVQALMKQMEQQDQAQEGPEEEDANADIDWDALETYEKFENYVQQQAKPSKGRASPAAAAGSSSGSSKAATQQVRSSSSSSQGSKQRAAASASSSAEASEQLQLDQDLDELEQLIKLFELADRQTSQEQLRRPAAPGQPQALVAEDDIDWQTVEQLLLGEQWDKELMEAGSDEGDIIDVTPSGAVARQGAADEEDEEEAPWADEVSTLLLGLVSISHKKYLAKPVLEPEPSEEQRAAAFWEVPFVLMVHDDSEQCLLEYGNKAALALFEMEYLDFFGTSSFAIVAPDETVQQDWIWAMRDVEERFEKYTVVPKLRMMSSTGRPFVAKDVLVFRVDSLEDEPIGQAVMFSKWQYE